VYLALVSAKGAPGVTTTAMAFTAAAAPRPRLLVELDPAGGDVEMVTGRPAEPGLPRIAAGLRPGQYRGTLELAPVDAVEGVPAVLAQAGGVRAEETLVRAQHRLGPALAELPALVVGDAGRWSSTQRTAARIEGAHLVVVVCQPSPSGIEHARWLVEELAAFGVHRSAIVLVGDRPYPIDEVRPVFRVPVVGPLPADARGVAALYAGGTDSWRWRFTLLGRAAPRVLDELVTLAGEVPHVA
jgi:MinD-like ATPase involved in chromosome partitioning or flagellar assembly